MLIKCPDRNCGLRLHPNVVRDVVCEESFAKYEQLLLQQSLAGQSGYNFWLTLIHYEDICWCPRCKNAVITDASNLGFCTNCLFSFCVKCLFSWHPGK